MTVLSIIFSAEQETHRRIRNAKQTATKKGGENMNVTEKNVKTSAVILNILAENKCTVAEAEEILSFCSKILRKRATVPEEDYLADFTARFLSSSL